MVFVESSTKEYNMPSFLLVPLSSLPYIINKNGVSTRRDFLWYKNISPANTNMMIKVPLVVKVNIEEAASICQKNLSIKF